MLNNTQFYSLTPVLSFVLWVETIVYLVIGLYEIADDFFMKPKPWTQINGKLNGFVFLNEKVGHKMHGSLCFLLGFIALNGVINGAVTRFELELCFVSLALLMMTVWLTLLPGKLSVVIVMSKPEFWLQLIMLIFLSHLVRPMVICICVALNLWGIAINIFHTRKKVFQPFTYRSVREDMLAAGVQRKKVKSFDKIAGYKGQ